MLPPRRKGRRPDIAYKMDIFELMEQDLTMVEMLEVLRQRGCTYSRSKLNTMRVAIWRAHDLGGKAAVEALGPYDMVKRTLWGTK